MNLSNIERIKPGAVALKAQTLPLCYATPLHYQLFCPTGAKVFPGGARRGRQLDPGGHDLPGVLYRKRNRPHRGREVEAGGTFLHQVSSQALLYFMKAIQIKALLSLSLTIDILVS